MGQLEGGRQRGPISQDNCPPGSESGGSTSTHPIKTQLKLFSDPSPPPPESVIRTQIRLLGLEMDTHITDGEGVGSDAQA